MNPNVLNIPRNLRSIFKAEEGNVCVIADFSQIVLRIASEYVGEEKMLFLRELLSSKGIVGHNLKFDLKYLYSYGIEPYAVFDTKIANLEVFIDGKGFLADGGSPGWLAKLLAKVLPF